ncbi:MAG: DUF1016 family protein [Candidatus Aminicenantes bacterium]|nr:DUF1016 family protein [Candidatus Aminicenantes bacterium]
MNIVWQDYIELKILKKKLSPKFDLLDYLGQGGCGRVFKIRDRNLSRDCALKILNLYDLTEESDEKREEARNRFIKEAEAIAKCKHHNIVSIYNIGGEDTFPYLIMEFIEGKSLDALITEKKRLQFKEILKISGAILPAVGYMHENGLIHRDLKPDNILLEKETGRIVIIDFSIARDILKGSHASEKGYVPGTPPYMAPEQFREKIVPGIDIYSYGVILYQMVTGEVPFDGKTLEIMQGHINNPVPDIRKKNPAAPVRLQRIIEKAMAKEPRLRYRKAEYFLKDIQGLGKTGKGKNKFFKGPFFAGKNGFRKLFTGKEPAKSPGSEGKYLPVENMEAVLLDKLQVFLLESDKGFAFISRRRRVTIGDDFFIVDLVFYHYVLKCFFLVYLKTGLLNHMDETQMDFYIRYFEKEEKQEGDNPTLGLIICFEEEKIAVKYVLPKNRGQNRVSEYEKYLPAEEELIDELTPLSTDN